MPGITRDSGQYIVGSKNVRANNQPVIRVGDRLLKHGDGKHANAVMISGSGNVYANNKKVCRAGDVASCGHRTSGSKDVRVNK